MAWHGVGCWWSFIIGFYRKLANLNLWRSLFRFWSVDSCISNDDWVNGGNVSNAAHEMDISLIERKLTRLVSKLQKYPGTTLKIFNQKDIHYGPLLGKGGESEVYKCTVMYKNVPVEAAAKTVLDNEDDAISITLDEIELLCLAHDPIISTTLKVYGVAAIPDDHDPNLGHLVIVTEVGLMNAMQLYQEEDLPLAVTFDFWKRLATAIHVMHSRHILHQDIKPENIIITTIHRNRQGNIEKIDFKIIDLGMGKRLYSKKIITDDILGTDGYHPPEVLYENFYDFRADVFMLGITFSVLLHSAKFLSNKSALDNFLKDIHLAKRRRVTGQALFDEIIAPTFEELQNIPPAISDMISQMLERQDRRTITLLDVVRICDKASNDLKSKHGQRNASPLSRRQCHNCRDSGFGSGDDGSKHAEKQHQVQAKRKRSASPTAVAPEHRRVRAKENKKQYNKIAFRELCQLRQSAFGNLCTKRLRRH